MKKNKYNTSDCYNAPITKLSELKLSPDTFILEIASTLDSTPTVAVCSSTNNTEIYKYENGGFAKLTTLTAHTDKITGVKFQSNNNNIIYTGAEDGSILLWDLRCPSEYKASFSDNSEDAKKKEIRCFDISPNDRFMAAGTNLIDGDSFILFWDLRKSKNFLGAYWESHSKEITQMKFHTNDSDRLLSGSEDGLINLYDISQPGEDSAYLDSFNTESASVDRIAWLKNRKGSDVIGCLTSTSDLLLWNVDDVQPYLNFKKTDFSAALRDEEDVYSVDLHDTGTGDYFVLIGSGKKSRLTCFKTSQKNLSPWGEFVGNDQQVRSSFYNTNYGLLFTGGEGGCLDTWDVSLLRSS